MQKNIKKQEGLAQAPESLIIHETDTEFCQGFLSKEAGKHVCLAYPKNLQQTLNLVKNHQNNSQAVDGQKSKGRQTQNKYCIRQVSLEEIRKVVVAAIKSGHKKAKPSDPCFFCRKPGHFKKDCKRKGLGCERKESKQQNLNG